MARLSYDAVTCQVWLDVMPERPGSVQEICELHVDRLTVPRGWMLCDRRVEEPAMFLTDPTPPPTRSVRTRQRASDPVRPEPVVEPGLFDPPRRSDAEQPDPVEEVEEVEEVEVEEVVIVEQVVVVDTEVDTEVDTADEAPADGALLRPSSPLLARAFRAAGTRPSVLAPRPDPGDDDGAAS